MTVHLLDTNTLSLLLRAHPEVDSRFREARRAGDQLILSPVVEFEIRRGLIRRRATAIEARFTQFTAWLIYRDFDRTGWRRAAELWAFSRDHAMPLPDADLLIAAQAMELGATLVTNNERHFRLFEPLGLTVENWATAPT